MSELQTTFHMQFKWPCDNFRTISVCVSLQKDNSISSVIFKSILCYVLFTYWKMNPGVGAKFTYTGTINVVSTKSRKILQGQQLSGLLPFPEESYLVTTIHFTWLTNACISSSRGSNTLFGPMYKPPHDGDVYYWSTDLTPAPCHIVNIQVFETGESYSPCLRLLWVVFKAWLFWNHFVVICNYPQKWYKIIQYFIIVRSTLKV